MSRTLIVVFGAGVRRDGTPSPVLRRRIAYAERAAYRHPNADLFLSGGVGRFGPSEAAVMREKLHGHVGAHRMHIDDRSMDTLETVMRAVRFARAHGYDLCLACTDRFHQPRVRMLFRLFGMPAQSIMFTRTETPGNRPWLNAHLREAAAIPYDLVAGLWARRRKEASPRG